jgi:sulfotransferase family protein
VNSTALLGAEPPSIHVNIVSELERPATLGAKLKIIRSDTSTPRPRPTLTGGAEPSPSRGAQSPPLPIRCSRLHGVDRERAVELNVVGAGLGRTGTASLKKALERLTGGRCYHMFEVLEQPEAVAGWHAVVRGDLQELDVLMAGYLATVDWPASSYWPELSAANPGAVVLLSSRATPEEWWASMERTIIPTLTGELPPQAEAMSAHRAMVLEMLDRRFTPDWREPAAAMAAYERHNERVRSQVPSEQLIDWRPGDGWQPICAALGVAVPSDPFPHENDSGEFHANIDSRAGR